MRTVSWRKLFIKARQWLHVSRHFSSRDLIEPFELSSWKEKMQTAEENSSWKACSRWNWIATKVSLIRFKSFASFLQIQLSKFYWFWYFSTEVWSVENLKKVLKYLLNFGISFYFQLFYDLMSLPTLFSALIKNFSECNIDLTVLSISFLCRLKLKEEKSFIKGILEQSEQWGASTSCRRHF